MPRAGLEPARPFRKPRILSPVRLPISPPRHRKRREALVVPKPRCLVEGLLRSCRGFEHAQVTRVRRCCVEATGRDSIQPVNDFRHARDLLIQILKRAGVVLVGLHLARSASSEALSFLSQDFQSQGREQVSKLLLLIALNFVTEIMWSALWAFVFIAAARAVMREEPLLSSRTLKDFNQVMVEGVRSLAAVIYRVPLLLIPAVFELFRLLFVPHVVMLDPNYSSGRVDALGASRAMIRRRWPLVLFATVSYLALSLSVETLTQGPGAGGDAGSDWFWQRPGPFLLSALLTLVISLVYEICLVTIFVRTFPEAPLADI